MRDFPPTGAFFDSNINIYDPGYVNTLPMVKAYGFGMCHKLAIEDPNQAVLNCDSVAFCALGKPDPTLGNTSEKRNYTHPPNIGLYLHKNDWGFPSSEGLGYPLL